MQRWRRWQGLDALIIDCAAIQAASEPSVALTRHWLWIAAVRPKMAYLTHMHVPLDYETVKNETPRMSSPAYDGLTIDIEL
jgi:phosphoribosyl 1,2-cyclic phosphate phosphodiesterase